MTPDPSVVRAWTAFLAVPPPQQAGFLDAALAYATAKQVRWAEVEPKEPVPQVVTPRPRARSSRMTPRVPLRPSTPIISIPLAQGEASELDRSLAVPLIGGPDFGLDRSARFLDPVFVDRWRPGKPLVVYLAGTPGLRALMQSLNRSGSASHSDNVAAKRGPLTCAFKVGTFFGRGADLDERMRRLRAQAYGAVWIDDKRPVVEPGFDGWQIEPLQPGKVEPSAGSPIRMGIQGIEVTLPATMTPSMFDQRLGKALCTASVASFALSAPGRLALEARNADPRQFVRYSPKPERRPTRAMEITFIRSKHGQDLTRLVRVIEDILFAHVEAAAGAYR